MSSWPEGLASFVAAPAEFKNTSSAGTIAVSGFLYRAIPHGATEPLNTAQSSAAGGRWNRPGSFPVLYTGSSIDVVRSFVDWHAFYYGLPLRTRPESDLPDLLVVSFESEVADAVTDAGLIHHGLPPTYPAGSPPQEHTVTQTAGQAMFDAGLAGVAARSATMTTWSGPIAAWADVAIFTTQSPPVRLVDRFEFDEWYADG